jgi:hypothetical protein
VTDGAAQSAGPAKPATKTVRVQPKVEAPPPAPPVPEPPPPYRVEVIKAGNKTQETLK